MRGVNSKKYSQETTTPNSNQSAVQTYIWASEKTESQKEEENMP